MESESYRWHFDYTRLAWESGFSFESNKNRKTFDRNKIALLDIDRIIRERDIAIVESHLDNILDYNLESDEFKILDSSFVKLFQLHQLSIEFLMYCKKFLDKTVVTLKNDLRKNIEDNDFLQKELTRIMSENNRLKKKVKDLKLSLHYQHQFQQTLNDQITIFQCNECGKTFINHDYLNSHLKRRHNIDSNNGKENMLLQEPTEFSDHTDVPEHEKYKNETDRLQSEIKVLKEKLNNTERYFNPDVLNHRNLSPEHGTVKIHKSQMHNENLNEVKELQKQFESLKDIVQTELNLIKTQKFVENSQENSLQKVLETIDSKNVHEMESNLYSVKNDCRNSYVQTDEIDFENLNEKNLVKPMLFEERNIIPKGRQHTGFKRKDEKSKSFIRKVDESSAESLSERSNLNLVKEEIEKKLEEKTKKEIEELGDQLTKKMATSFNLLEERMETFWNKFNEKTSLVSESPSPIPAYTKKQFAFEVAPEQSKTGNQIDNVTTKIDVPSNKSRVSSSESDSLSETESNRHILSDIEISEPMKPQPIPRKTVDKKQQILIDELRTKVHERKMVADNKIEADDLRKKNPTKILISSNKKSDMTHKQIIPKVNSNIEKPVVTKVFSKTIKSSQTETESGTNSSESETEISSEDDEVEEKVREPQGLKINSENIKKDRKETAIQRQFMRRSQSAPLRQLKPITRDAILEDYNSRLEELGIDPAWNLLKNTDYKEKSKQLSQDRTLIEKKYPSSFTKIRDQILQEIEIKIQSISHPNLQKNLMQTQEISPKPSRFKNIISSVKTKLMSIKTEKSPTRSTPLYKLTVHKDIPPEHFSDTEKITTPKKIRTKEKNPVRREKIIIKPKKMYVDSSSETKSDDEILKKKKSTLGNSGRKSISVTSLASEKKGSVQNIAQSLDSILEMKKEIIAEINKENITETLKDFSSSEDSLNVVKKSPMAFQKQKLTYEIPEHKTGVLDRQSISSSEESIKEVLKKPSPDFWEEKLTYEIPEQNINVQKGVLKYYPSASSLTKKKVIFDLDLSENEKSDKVKNVDVSEPKKVKTNSFFDFDLSKDDDSTSVTSSVFDSKLNLDHTDSDKGKIKTKAQINVESKKIKKDSESDFDISDLL